MSDERLITLACEIDSHLQRELDSRDVLESSVESLTPADFRELERAEQIIALLEATRRNMARYGEDFEPADAESQEGGDASTLRATSKTKSAAPPVGTNFNEEPHLAKVGRFEIIEPIGQGGFARVFLARDPHLDRNVAIKLPLPKTMENSVAIKRFQREARAAAVLGHPAIVPIHEIGQSGPITYIAMGYCPGATLNHWFEAQARNIAPEEAARIVSRLADATEHAHCRGVVHRDLKPGNILVAEAESTNTDISGRLRITDFGLARLATEVDETLTMEGSVIGTPAYMSPEQAAGSSEIGPTTDLFSLGAILYELLTGERPFSRDTHLATLRAIENDHPVLPRRRDASIPKDLESICLKCLRKSPPARYATAYDLHTDLERFLRGEPVSARPATKWEKSVAWARRNPSLAIATALALMTFLLGLFGTTSQWRRAQASLERSRAEVARTRRVAAFLGRTYRSPTPTQDGRDVKVVDVLERAEMEVAKEFANDPATRWELLHQIGSAYSGLGLVEKSVSVLQSIYQEQQAANLPASMHRVDLLSDLADATNSDGKFAKASEFADAAYEQATRLMGEQSILARRIKTRQAMIRQNAGDTEQARRLYSELVETLEKQGDRLELLKRKIDLARVMRVEGDAEQAKPMMAQVLAELTENFGDDHTATIGAVNEYLAIANDLKDFELAATLARQSLERSIRVFGDDHPQTLQAMSNFGSLLSNAKRHDQAIEILNTCIEKCTQKFGPESPFTMVSTYSLAQAFQGKGDLANAKEKYWIAYNGFRNSIGGTHHRTLKCAKLLSRLLTEQGNEGELQSLRRQVDLDRKNDANH